MTPRSAAARARAQRGLTLVELMVTLSVFALLLGLGVPGLQQLVAAQRMRSASYDLVSDLVLARSEAVKRSTTVQVVPLEGGWAEGWRILRVGATEPLAEREGLGGVSVTMAPEQVSFDFNGRVLDADAAVRIGLTDGKRSRCITLDPTGRARSAATECSG